MQRIDATTARALTLDEARSLSWLGEPELVLGRTTTTLYWAIEAEVDDNELEESHHLDGLRGLHGVLDDTEWNIGGRATQVLDWLRDHRYCGRCGTPLERSGGERAMQCPVDGLSVYPRLSPAVIMLVERDDGRCLLGRSSRWDVPMYSTLAGFVEPGETLEETVHREIYEEVGVHVKDVTYFGSQPWPFPNSLMIGFQAKWAGGDIRIDPTEIADARWFSHDELPMIPGKPSIARELIDAWLERVSA